jgi:hypothetical protein
MTIRSRRHSVLLVAAVAGAVVSSVERGETHKPITSKYTYNEDVFPILRDRCGRCHAAEGVAPMSLMTYAEAFPWAEAVRAEIIAGHMPPWHAQEGSVRFKNAPTITAAEIDKILVWVSGGNPQGNPQNNPAPVALRRDWPAGTPDLVLQLPEAALAADKSEVTQEFTIATRTTEPRWIRSADLLPGTPSIVRNATISMKGNLDSTEVAPEQVLAVWVSGEDPVSPDGAAFQLPAGAELIVRVHYKKTYGYEGKAMSDRSAVGLYFGQDSSTEIQRFAMASAPVSGTSDPISFSRTVSEDLQALAFRPDPSLSNARLQVDAVSPAGVRTPVIRLAVRPDWTRRYWFEQPLTWPRGTRIEVVAELNGADTLLPPSGSPLPPQVVDGTPVRVTFDVSPYRYSSKEP